MVIDAHQHLWQIGRNDLSWPTPDLDAIHRDFMPADLREATEGLGISGTVLVQSQPSETDTSWLMLLARAEPLIQAVVGWTDLLAPSAPQRIAWLARQPKLKGLRPMLQGLDDDWILQEAVQPALAAMSAHGLRFDALVYSRHLPAIDRLAQTYPDMSIIIDHGAKPPISRPKEGAAWRKAISHIARHPNVTCKLSGLLTETAANQDASSVLPYVDHLFDCFGPDRLMWGSDWPVVLLKDSYRAWFDWTQGWLSAKDTRTRDAILGGTARLIYELPHNYEN